MMHLGRAGGGMIRWAHILWAILAVAVCVLLVVTGGGHPPPIVFLPPVVVIWVVGHLLLWGVGWLAARGRSTSGRSDGEARAWPLGLSLALVGAGAVAVLGVFQLVMSLVLWRWYPFGPPLWLVAMLVAFAHTACFLGILLRRAWSRLAAAALSTGWALVTVWQLLEQLARGYRTSMPEIAILLSAATLFAWLGYHLLASPQIKKFLLKN